MLILESLESATARRARILGEIIAYSYCSDGNHLTLPSGDGALRCIKSALAQAGLRPEQIDYVKAHATGTLLGDRVEAAAIQAVFGSSGPPVSSTKGMTGHECWMAGASEVIYALLMMRDGFLAGNVNFEEFDDETPHINILRRSVTASPRTVLTNSFGFGGTNACLVLRRFDG
jgi:3-oxoacyl-[acyl-carrier-protein] synthase-1